jgi:hypothetical protein
MNDLAAGREKQNLLTQDLRVIGEISESFNRYSFAGILKVLTMKRKRTGRKRIVIH